MNAYLCLHQQAVPLPSHLPPGRTLLEFVRSHMPACSEGPDRAYKPSRCGELWAAPPAHCPCFFWAFRLIDTQRL
ncbi:hypothetical protein AOLI_G00135810 [Acnodon oligacanthus]